MPKLRLHLPLTKIDSAKREVSGCAAAEEVDKSGEILDYIKSKPFFQKWSDEISKATDGENLGNIREMHQLSAVGKTVALSFDDANKKIYVTGKIVDDAAWKKCEEAVYTGFSIGGLYKDMWEDGENIRYVAEPYEISVVDNPCVGSATFEYVKASGEVEIRKFANVTTTAPSLTTTQPILVDPASAGSKKSQETTEMTINKSHVEAMDHLKKAMESQAACAEHMGNCMKAMGAAAVSAEHGTEHKETGEPAGFNEGYKTEIADLKKAVADLTAKIAAPVTPAVAVVTPAIAEKEEPKAARAAVAGAGKVEKTHDTGSNRAAKAEEEEFIPGVDPRSFKAIAYAKNMKPVVNELPAGVVEGFAAR
jgi:hypothetical protein